MRTVRFGVLSRALHPPTGDPTLQLEQELALAELADRLGLDEFWWGETHARGWPVVADPMLMVARAAGSTSRIRLGAAVSALTVHHPTALVDSAMQLDHLTRGRFELGLGADVEPSEVAMAGYRPAEAELAIAETAKAVAMLLGGRPVTMTPRHAPWLLRGSAPILAGYDGDLDVRLVALGDSAGPELAGHHGWGLMGGSSVVGGEPAQAWQRVTEAAERAGRAPAQDCWSVVTAVHVAPTEEEARQQVRAGIARMHDVDGVVDAWLAAGRAAVGTPSVVAAHLERLIERSGGVGTVLVEVTGWASPADARASLELLAREVIPQVRGMARTRVSEAASAAGATASERRRGRRAAPTPVRGVPVGAQPRPAVRYDATSRQRGRHAVDVPAAD